MINLKLLDHDNNVSAIVNKFEEIVSRIHSHGKTWDDEIPSMFRVLFTSGDSHFDAAIKTKEKKHLSGSLTELSELTWNWMVPDAKQVKIAALLTKVTSLEAAISSGSKATFTADGSTGAPKTYHCKNEAYRLSTKETSSTRMERTYTGGIIHHTRGLISPSPTGCIVAPMARAIRSMITNPGPSGKGPILLASARRWILASHRTRLSRHHWRVFPLMRRSRIPFSLELLVLRPILQLSLTWF